MIKIIFNKLSTLVKNNLKKTKLTRLGLRSSAQLLKVITSQYKQVLIY